MILKSPPPITDDSRMPFGEHKGECMRDVPVRYFHWLFTQKGFDRKSSVGQYIERNLPALEMENPDLIW